MSPERAIALELSRMIVAMILLLCAYQGALYLFSLEIFNLVLIVAVMLICVASFFRISDALERQNR